MRTAIAIHQNFTGTNRILWNLELLKIEREIKKKQVKKHDFSKKSSRWKVIKDQLLNESHNKCAYCDTPTKVVAFGDVEHFRPKSIYWWLAYCYDNYLPSCTICNQMFKSDNFPVINTRLTSPNITLNTTDKKLNQIAPFINTDPLNEEKGMSWRDFANLHKSEKALLLNPYYEDPAKFIGYKADDIIKEVELIVLAKVKHRAEIQNALNEVYGLNRLELKQFRYQVYKPYSVHRDTLKDSRISPATRQINEQAIKLMTSDDWPYAGMIRYFESI